ncbi:MAG: hypothetical protein P1V97_09820 [Planctomycetota bacterium]|nr:hypothetical protein [Planctomycetota bacterium]
MADHLTPEAAVQPLLTAKRCLVLTGAGLSVASGLPVYRGQEHSLYDDPDQLRDAMASTLHKDPEAYWQRHAVRRHAMGQVKPNAAHHALVQLEVLLRSLERDFLLATQNVDNLHRRAGQRAVHELHGNCFWLRCLDYQCLGRERDETDPEFVSNLKAPRCDTCGGILRPDMILFGEADERRWEALNSFITVGVDLVLLIGSSGVVSVPEKLLQFIASTNQSPYVLEINPKPTEDEPWGKSISGHLVMNAEEALPKLLDLLKAGV